MAFHRPYIRKSVREEVERRAEKNEKGQFIDPNTGKVIEGKYELGHKTGHEHWREAMKAEEEGLTQSQFNDRMNDPDKLQIEDPHSNHTHEFEDKSEFEESKVSEKLKSTQENSNWNVNKNGNDGEEENSVEPYSDGESVDESKGESMVESQGESVVESQGESAGESQGESAGDGMGMGVE